MVTMVLDERLGMSKERFMETLASESIDSRPFFYPLSSLKAYADTPSAAGASARNPVSYRLGATGVNLPSSLSLEHSDVSRVCEVVRQLLGVV